MYGRSERDHRRLGGRVDSDCKVFLGGLSVRWTEDDILSFMGKYGRIVQISIIKNPSGDSKGFGFVVFETPEEASASLGQVKYGTKFVEVKPSIKQQNEPHQSSNMRAPSGRTSKEVHSVRHEPDNSHKLLSSKLSKHSKDFQNLVPVSDIDVGDAQEDSRMAVNIIELTSKDVEDKDYYHVNFTESSKQSNVKNVKKSDERNFGISKLSKEFHPASSIHELSSQGAAQSYIGPFNPLATMPFGHALFMPFPATDIAQVYDLQKAQPDGLGLPPASASADLKIKFFTFPGRD